jgi:predicted DNA binding protein
MSYQTKVEPLALRSEMIAERVGESKETETFHEFQNREHKLPVITLPLHVPIYRMANFRTRVAQQSYLRRAEKDSSFFQQENEEAQNAQHQILVKFAQEERDRSIASIVGVLKDERQRQPLLITSQGVVVNGNRRLAAMRELYDEDSSQFRNFSHVKCLVLPPTITEDEVVEIEVRLQMKRRTELPYTWIDEAIAIRELRESGKSMRDLCALMNKSKSDIEDAINALAEAELFLTDRRGTPGDYEAVENAKELFFDMGGSLSAKQGEAQEISRRFAWTLVEKRGKGGLPGRVYNFNPMFGKKADEVAERLAERMGIELQSTDSPADVDSDEAFDIDIETSGETSFRPLIALFDDPTTRDGLADELLEVWDNIVEADKGKKRSQQPLNLVQQANGKLAEVDLTEAAPASLPAIEKQLDAIETSVGRLRAVIAAKKSGKPDVT